jgi:nicotinate-nucleotide adenylyltransferase
MKIGLLGGSFNPPHLGHLHISKLAIKKLQLKQLWWLPTLQNPFKQQQQYIPYLQRLILCKQIIRNEQKIICKNQPYYFTFSLIKTLQKKYPQHKFNLICGADCVATMHHWQHFKRLLKIIEINIFARDIDNRNILIKAKKTPAYCLAKKQQNMTKMQMFFTSKKNFSATKIRETKIVILLNESIKTMKVGLNSTLFFALSATMQGKEVFFLELHKNIDFLQKPPILPILLKLNQSVAMQLLAKYAEENEKIRENAKQEKYYHLKTVEQWLLNKHLTTIINNQNQIENIFANAVFLNRIEPMKFPFPPEGQQDFMRFLTKLQQKFSNIHCPIGLSDKEYISDLSTPCKVIKTADIWQNSSIVKDAILKTITCFQNMYQQQKNAKIVIKPKDSAQSLGVFSIEFQKQVTINKRSQSQQYQLPFRILENEQKLLAVLQDILKQQCNLYQEIKDVYGQEILLQPFLLGVEIGDFRTILLKDTQQKFIAVGTVFRKKITTKKNDFTTCASKGQAIVCGADQYLPNLQKFIDKTLQYLQENSEKYRNVHFIGLDFIAKDRTATEFFLGEMNMHCPALISMLGNNFNEILYHTNLVF